jgi:hypothetical protein
MTNNRITRLWRHIRQSWHPTPLEKPVVDEMFPEMDALQRSAESFRYSFLSWEFWMSPNGQVREWLRHNTRAALFIGVPALILLPIIGIALAQMAAWTIALSIIAGHLIIIPVLLVVLVLVVLSLIKLIKSIFC